MEISKFTEVEVTFLITQSEKVSDLKKCLEK